MLYLSQVDKFYGQRKLLDGVSLHVRPGEKVGLVGLNGAGKSTLLRLIVGLEEPDGGSVAVRKGARVGYLPQEVLSLRGESLLAFIMDAEQAVSRARATLEATEQALEEASAAETAAHELARLAERQGEMLHELERLGGYNLAARASQVAAGLGFSEAELARPLEGFSGGWMMRAALARLLLAQPEVLLLDEPTNHLDLDSLLWLEDYLRASRSAVLLVSHDRTFLDRLVTRVVEVEAGALTSYPGDYERYLAARELREAQQWAAWEAQEEAVERIRRFIERNRVRKDRTRQVQARIRQLETMERVSPPSRPRSVAFQFPEPARSGDRVLELAGVEKRFGARGLYGGLDLTLRRGDRLALLGANGAGKTTLLRIMAGRCAPDAGTVRHGANVAAGFFAQDQAGELDPSRSVIEELACAAGVEVTQGQLRALLGAFLFSGEEVEKRVSVLSGGERSRLALCKLLLAAPNLLLLDEPTNHLDIASRDVLERALEAYRGTLVIATHDRRLMNRLASQVLVLEGCQARLYAGNYDDWRRLAGRQAEAEPEPAPEPKPSPNRRPDRELKVLEARWRQEKSRLTAPLRARIDELLARIEAAERELSTLEAELAKPETYSDHAQARRLHARQVELRSELERELLPEWERAAADLERLERQMEDRRPRGSTPGPSSAP